MLHFYEEEGNYPCGTVEISTEEYADLIDCRTRINFTREKMCQELTQRESHNSNPALAGIDWSELSMMLGFNPTYKGFEKRYEQKEKEE